MSLQLVAECQNKSFFIINNKKFTQKDMQNW